MRAFIEGALSVINYFLPDLHIVLAKITDYQLQTQYLSTPGNNMAGSGKTADSSRAPH